MPRSAKTLQLLPGVLLAAAVALAGIPSNYYDTANPGSAAQLRSSLHTIIKAGHNKVGYNNTWTALETADEDPGNPANVLLMYTNQSRIKTAHCGSSGCSDLDPLAGTWSREHIFCQSTFGSDEPMQSDLHHLFAIDQDVNGWRNDSYFDWVTDPIPHYSVAGSIGTTYTWQPREDQRGDVARACFYMDIRYEGDSPEPNLTLVNTVPGGSGSGEMGHLDTLLQWHLQDPPDAFEIARNNKVYDLQHNANPFIDHPEWVSIIYSAYVPTDGDTLTVTASDLATTTTVPGVTLPMIGLHLAASAHEWDMASLDVTQTGTIPDNKITAVSLYWDTNSNGLIDGGETPIVSTTLSSGAATIAPSAPYRILPAGTDLILGLTLSPTAPIGSTVQLNLAPSSIVHSTIGGADINPANPAFASRATGIGTCFISEYVEGSSNNKAIEIYNGTSSAINLATNNFHIGVYNNGSPTVTTTAHLTTGTIPAGGTFVVCNSSAGAPLLGVSQLTSGSINFNGDDAVVLTDGAGTVLDVIGQVGLDPGTQWGTNPTTTLDHTLRRSPRIVQGDTNGADAFDPSVEWTGSAIDDFSGLGSHTLNPAPVYVGVSSSCTEDQAGTVTVTFGDSDNPAPATEIVAASAVTAGALGAGVVASTGGGNFTATFPYTPAANFEGAVTFTFSVNDGLGAVTTAAVPFAVTPVNDLPTISSITMPSIAAGNTSSPVPFTVGDVETPPADLFFEFQSTDEAVVPLGNIILGGSGASRTVSIQSVLGQPGTSDVTITVTDDDTAIASSTFTVNVTPVTYVGDWTAWE